MAGPFLGRKGEFRSVNCFFPLLFSFPKTDLQKVCFFCTDVEEEEDERGVYIGEEIPICVGGNSK